MIYYFHKFFLIILFIYCVQKLSPDHIFIIFNWYSGKNLKISVFFYTFQFSESKIFHISCYELDELWPKTEFSHQTILQRIL